MKRLRLAILAFAFFLPVLAAGSIARANCSNPTDVAGQEIYNTTYHVSQYCNGTTWKAEGPTGFPTNGLVGWWKLDETSGTSAADSSGSGLTGTLTGVPVWTASGKINGALSFNSADPDLVQAGVYNASGLNFGTGSFTYAAWIQTTGAGGQTRIIGSQSNTDGYVWLNMGGAWFIEMNPGSGGDYMAPTSLVTVNDGSWHHIALVVDRNANNIYMYTDGVLSTTTPHTFVGTFGTSADPMVVQIGRQPGCCALTGTIDDVRVYNRALSAAEISALYNYSAPKGYFVMSKTTWNGNLGGILAAADALCLTDLTTNTGWQGYAPASSNGLLVSGNVHAFLAYDGSTANVLRPQETYIFANANDATAGGASFTTDGNGDGPNDSANWSGLTYFNGSFNYWSDRDTNSPTSWKDILQSTNSCSTTNSWDTGTNAKIGSIANSAYTDANRWEVANTFTCDTLEHLICYVNSTKGACSNPAGAEGDEIYNSTYHVYQFCNGANWIAEGPASTFDNGVVGWWKLDESSGTTASDLTVNGRTGTLTNSPVWQPSGGKINGALKFAAANDYVTSGAAFPELGTTQQPYSFSFWINPAAAVTDGEIVHASQNANGAGGGWCVGFVNLTGGKIVANSWNGATNTVTSNATITPGQWYHVVNTWDPTNGLQIYINGSYDNSVAQPTFSGSGASDYVFLGFGYGLGCVGDVAAHFTGMIDDFRVYNRAMSGAEVLALYNSKPGLIWTQQNGSGSHLWTSVASSSDGSKLVASVVNSNIYTSTDSGVTWTASGASALHWVSVASSSDGAKLVAVVNAGQIYTSTDSGGTWTARDSNRGWNYVASSSDGVKLAAVVTIGYIYTSTDSGVTWTQQTGSGSRNWQAIASSSDGTKLVAIEYTGQIYTSTDSGVTWTARDSARNWQAVASSSDGTKLVAANYGGQIYTSTDSGVTWTAQASGSLNWYGVASSSDGTKLAAIVNGGQIYISTDSGVTWTAQTSAGSAGWHNIASSSDGTKLVAVDATPGYVWTGGLAGGGTCANPTDVEGKKTYNTTFNVMQFCNGSTWVNMAW